MNGVITMRHKDLERIKIIHRLSLKLITQREAGKLLHITDRQIRTLFKRYQELGDKGVISKKIGNTNRKMPQTTKDQALKLITQNYSDFGPTLAAEKLRKVHGITMAVETIRQLMTVNRLWIPNVARPAKTHPLRARRSCFGELILIDGSIELWFEDRGPKCVLLVFIDDATSRILKLFFTPTECLEGYFHAMEKYLNQYGRPLAIYCDRHAVFQVERKSPSSEEEHMTQFERAMRELDIKLIHANSPQAKGRVERCNRTLQDRFIKELRLRDISSIEKGNEFAEQYRLEHNRNFEVPAAQSTDLHRPLEKCHDLGKILRPNHVRTIQKDLTFSYEGEIYQVKWVIGQPRLHGKMIKVWVDDHGMVQGEHNGDLLEIEMFKHLEHHPIITQESAKRWILRKPRYKPNMSHPYKNIHNARNN